MLELDALSLGAKSQDASSTAIITLAPLLHFYYAMGIGYCMERIDI